MRVFILGGSNSVARDGWVAHLIAALPDVRIVNLSVGGSTSLMAYFRLTEVEDLGPDDLVIWEYALNDQNHIATDRPLDMDRALEFTERTLNLAVSNGARFLALVLRGRNFIDDAVPSAYRGALRALLQRRAVPVVDLQALYLHQTGATSVPGTEYASRLHLHPDGRLVRLAAAACAAWIAAPGAALASADAPLPGPEVMVTRAFTGLVPVPFQNSLMRQSLWRPGRGTVEIFRPNRGRWRILGVAVVASPQPACFALRVGALTQVFSACHTDPDFPRPMMRMLICLDRKPLHVGPAAPLHLVGWDQTDGPIRPGITLGELPDNTGLVGLLLGQAVPPGTPG